MISLKGIQYPSQKQEISSYNEIHLHILEKVIRLFKVCKEKGSYNMLSINQMKDLEKIRMQSIFLIINY